MPQMNMAPLLAGKEGQCVSNLQRYFTKHLHLDASSIAHPARHTCHTGQNGNHRKNAAVHHQRSAIIRIGAEYTKSEAASLPVSEAFPHPDFIGLGVGRAYPQGWPHRFGGVFKPHVHSSDLNNLRMVFEIPEGIKAMQSAYSDAVKLHPDCEKHLKQCSNAVSNWTTHEINVGDVLTDVAKQIEQIGQRLDMRLVRGPLANGGSEVEQ